MINNKIYKVVISMEFPDGSMEYVIWEPEFFGKMRYAGMDISKLFYDTSSNGFLDAPVDVLVELWKNPQVKKITSKTGDKEVLIEICVGEKIIPLARY